MDYLGLCNKVINEGGLEQNELTAGNWDSLEAGRRLYPRIKRAVAEAWKAIQMDRNEWEFSTAELTATMLPRILVDGVAFTAPSAGPEAGVKYKGADSGLELTVITVTTYTSALLNMEEDTSVKMIEFSADGGYNRALIGEVFIELSPNPGLSSFAYRGRAPYKLSEFSEFAREPHWGTFIAYQDTQTPTPVAYIPWENWVYKELSYTTATRSAPNFVSQDYNGNLVFYPQTLSPFTINFVCDLAPQLLVDSTDTPSLKLLPAELHEWIAWEALESIARFDKNPDLVAYANKWTTRYRRKAERSLMPLMSWAASEYNKR
jgi:hypothetical protein